MGAIKLSDNVYWVGVTDASLRSFHGYKIPLGTTYNSYLIIDDKITLIDTVKSTFCDQLIRNISEIVHPNKIDYIICNHVEPDHSGSLPNMLQAAAKAQIVTSPNGKKGLMSYYKSPWNFKIVKTGDSLRTGKYSFQFVQTPMIHWPDNMVTYIPELKTLFSNDAFGQHIASVERFDGELGLERALASARDYYANIVLPFGTQVQKALSDIATLDINMICPSHGIIWTEDGIPQITKLYSDWSANKTNVDEAVIVYDTMWGSTKMLADDISSRLVEQGKQVAMMSLRDSHISEVMTQLLTAQYICVGSPTLNRSIMPTIAAFLCYMKGLSPKNRKAIAFGSYGWSGESTGIIRETFDKCGFEIVDEVKVKYRPD